LGSPPGGYREHISSWARMTVIEEGCQRVSLTDVTALWSYLIIHTKRMRSRPRSVQKPQKHHAHFENTSEENGRTALLSVHRRDDHYRTGAAAAKQVYIRLNGEMTAPTGIVFVYTAKVVVSIRAFPPRRSSRHTYILCLFTDLLQMRKMLVNRCERRLVLPERSEFHGCSLPTHTA
jgi:hypothetical protein